MTDASVPLFLGDPASPILLGAEGRVVDRATFLRQVMAAAAALPEAPAIINVCETRHGFLVALCAAVVRGQTSLMPPSRAPEAIADLLARHPGSTRVGDASSVVDTDLRLPAVLAEVDVDAVPQVRGDATAVIVFTSGSTGVPSANAKSWASMQATTRANLSALRHLVGAGTTPIVATVPPQHMYGMETSVLMPLFGPYAVHEGRPFFPGDVAEAIAHCDVPPLLVTTPVHLRALVAADTGFPPVAGIVSATAPLPVELAAAAEARLGAEVREMFGSTETCVIAHRRTARETAWRLLDSVTLTPETEGTWVSRDAYAAPIRISDILNVSAQGDCFELVGRHADLLEIAGKRASLADLNRLLCRVEGVQDGVMLQLHNGRDGHSGRMVAFVVGPAEDAQILEFMRDFVDPVFLPRRIHHLPHLPRNETGKLSRAALLALTGN